MMNAARTSEPMRTDNEARDAKAIDAAIDISSTVYGDYDDAAGALTDIYALLAPMVERGYSKPREAGTDERADLIEILADNENYTYYGTHAVFEEGYAADAILAAGYSKQHPPTVTDEMVEAAAERMHMRSTAFEGRKPWSTTTERIRSAWRDSARDAISAALGAVHPVPQNSELAGPRCDFRVPGGWCVQPAGHGGLGHMVGEQDRGER